MLLDQDASRRPSLQALSFQPDGAAALSMKNGLYSVHIHMLDGVRGRDSGVLTPPKRRDYRWGPYLWSAGSYTVGGFSGTFADDRVREKANTTT